MKHLSVFAVCLLLSISSQAQLNIETPYNPDVNGDSFIGFTDFLSVLGLFSYEFLPADDMLNELQWLEISNDTLYLRNAISHGLNDSLLSQLDSSSLAYLNSIEDMSYALLASGPSAYDIWLNQGNNGTEADFIADLQGVDGMNGADGADGIDGVDGVNGTDGVDGADGMNGADGVDGVNGTDGDSAYQIWLELGNEGTEADFINSLNAAVIGPSEHGMFDSEAEGNLFVVPQGLHTLSIELNGASGGSGGSICAETAGTPEPCNLTGDSLAQGGTGGRAFHLVGMLYNLQAGDTLQLTSADSGADSGEIITCQAGPFGWEALFCGPASDGESAEITVLSLNNVAIAEISGGAGGTGGCVGCIATGPSNGSEGANGTLDNAAVWFTILTTSLEEENTGSQLILRY